MNAAPPPVEKSIWKNPFVYTGTILFSSPSTSAGSFFPAGVKIARSTGGLATPPRKSNRNKIAEPLSKWAARNSPFNLFTAIPGFVAANPLNFVMASPTRKRSRSTLPQAQFGLLIPAVSM